jgi:hypothetical protein
MPLIDALTDRQMPQAELLPGSGHGGHTNCALFEGPIDAWQGHGYKWGIAMAGRGIARAWLVGHGCGYGGYGIHSRFNGDSNRYGYIMYNCTIKQVLCTGTAGVGWADKRTAEESSAGAGAGAENSSAVQEKMHRPGQGQQVQVQSRVEDN